MNILVPTAARRTTIWRFAYVAMAISVAGVAPAALASADDLQPVTIRIASDHSPPPHPAAIAQEFFKQRLSEVMPGSVLRIFTAGALYTVPEAMEAMTEGNLEMTWGQFGKSAQVDPYMSVVNGPMLLTTPGAINELDEFSTYSMLVERFRDIHDIKVFGSGHLSMYLGVGASERLLTPDDFTGKKIRSTGPAENAALKAWGANAITMAFGDVPPALETGVIDGLITSLGGFVVVKDQAPFFTIAGINGLVGDYYWIGASRKWWNSLNPVQQEVLGDLIVDEVIPFQKRINWCNDKRLIERYGTADPAKPGIYIMNAQEQAVLAEKLGDATTQWVKANTPDGADPWADRFVEEARAASQRQPLGTSWLESTDCSRLQPWFDRFQKK